MDVVVGWRDDEEDDAPADPPQQQQQPTPEDERPEWSDLPQPMLWPRSGRVHKPG